MFVISFSLAFLSFTHFLLLTLPIIPCFFSSCFFISVFKPIFFIQKDLGLCGPNNVDWIKKVLGPICLCLPKPFYGRSVFCCRLLSLAFLSLDLSCSWSSWQAFGSCFSLGFPPYGLLDTNSQKWASTPGFEGHYSY